MSYPRDLDEYAASELRNELEARKTSRANGRCDYCGRQLHTLPTCKYPHRHAGDET
ncbi:MAG: hypothetical protein ACE1ZA_04640 [Pseudomonadales bacterium]